MSSCRRRDARGGGSGLCGVPVALIDALLAQGARDPVTISDDCGVDDGLALREIAPGSTVDQVVAATGAPLRIDGDVPAVALPAGV